MLRLLLSFAALLASVTGLHAATLADIRDLGPGHSVTITRAIIGSDFDLISSTGLRSFTVQDETGGITVFGSNAAISALLDGRSAGDALLGLSGQTGEFNGLLQLQGPFGLTGSEPGDGPQAPLPATTDDFQPGNPEAERLESRLVTLRNVAFQQTGLFGTGNYSVSDGERTVTVRVATSQLPIVGTAIPTGTVNVTGVFSQFTTSIPADDGYQLMIREPADVALPTAFESWQTGHFSGREMRDPRVGGPGGDPDGDRLPNIMEFAFGGDPRVPHTAARPETFIGDGWQTRHLRLRFLRHADRQDLLYRVQASSDLNAWQIIWSSADFPYPSAAGDSFWQNASDPVAIEDGQRRFLRLLVQERDDIDQTLPPLSIVSWNIEWFPGRSPSATPEEEEAHIQQVKTYLAGQEPDVLLLQEVRDMASVTEAVALLDGFEVHVVSAFTLGGSQPARQQLAVASRLPAHSAFAEPFTAPVDSSDPTPPRGFAFAALELPGDRVLLCYSLHLKSNASGDTDTNIRIREESARQVMAHEAEMRAAYAHRAAVYSVVGGDLNTRLEQEDMAHEQTIEIVKAEGFHWTWEGVPFSQRVTWPGRGGFPDATFDHILTRGPGWPVARVLTQPSPDLSDHNPVEIVLE